MTFMAALKGLVKVNARVEARRLPNMAGAHFIAIDPGKRYFGWAEFHLGALLRCGYAADLEYARELAAKVRDCVIEQPRVYAAKRIDQNDIAELAFSAGIVAGKFRHFAPVLPQQWKGTADGEVMLNRIKARLVERLELSKLPEGLGAREEHVLDACGLGLRCCGVEL